MSPPLPSGSRSRSVVQVNLKYEGTDGIGDVKTEEAA
jgi:hypothetical protein